VKSAESTRITSANLADRFQGIQRGSPAEKRVSVVAQAKGITSRRSIVDDFTFADKPPAGAVSR